MKTTANRTRALATPSILSALGVGLGLGSSVEGQIQFSFSGKYPTINTVRAVTTTDLNGDALDDVAIIAEFGEVTIFLNQGDGELGYGQVYFPESDKGLAITGGDLDRDGDGDLVWVNGDGVYVFLNDGSGVTGTIITLSTDNTARTVQLGDLDADGDLDVVVATRSALLTFEHLNDGEFQPLESRPLPYRNPEDLQLGDVDNDGDLDIVVLSVDAIMNYYYGYKVYASELLVFINDGAGRIAETRTTELPYGWGWNGQFPRSVALADFDNDKNLEIAIVVNDTEGSRFSYLGLMENSGNGYFQYPAVEYELASASDDDMPSIVADADGDGDVDLILLNGVTSRITILENLGGPFGDFSLSDSSAPWGSATLTRADLNGNGRWDLVTAGSNRVLLFENTTAWLGLHLEGQPFLRDLPTTLTLEGLDPFERATFLYSMQGAGPSRGFTYLGGMTLDLTGTIQILGSRNADANGTASLTFKVPANSPLVSVATQAIVQRGNRGKHSLKSNFLRTMVQEP